jgi:2'-5' RNA ligase
MRTFLAIDLTSALEQKIGQWMDDHVKTFPDGSIRWVDPAALHLTVKFLGEIDGAKIGPVRNALAPVGVSTPVFSFRVAGFGAFPRRSRPRVLWLGIEEQAGVLADLYLRLNQSLGPLGFDPDRRGYTPHLTLGRVRRGIDKGIQRRVADAAQRMEVGALGDVAARELVFYKSTLLSTGAVHEVIDRFPFAED